MNKLKWKGLWRLGPVFALAACLSGCAHGTTGYRISEETVAFIHPGTTTRSEVVENLGSPLYELPDPHVMAYSWGRVRGVVTGPATGGVSAQPSQASPMSPQPAPMLNGSNDNTETVESRRWICCIALDSNERVTRFGTFEMKGAGSLEQAVRQWVASGQ